MLKIFSLNKNKIQNEPEELNKLQLIDQLTNEEKFNNIICFAKEILSSVINNNSTKQHPIFDLIRILGRGLQSEYMKYLVYYGDKDTGRVPNLDWNSIGFPDDKFIHIDNNNNKYLKVRDIIKVVKAKKKINLSRDLVLPWPWKRERLLSCMLNIGEGRKWGSWNQDFNNHDVVVWLPIGLAWVWGGNHSITIGIIQGGEVVPKYYQDMSELYNYVRSDGKNFIRIEDNEILSTVKSVEFAAIFEIGRLLKEQNISFID